MSKNAELYSTNEEAVGIPLEVSGRERFAASTGYRDVWAAVLFVLSLCVATGFGVASYLHLATWPDFGNMDFPTCVVVVFAISLTTAIVALHLFREYPVQCIVASWVFLIVITILDGVRVWLRYHLAYPGIILIAIAVIQAIVLYMARSRLPLAGIMLSTACKLVLRYFALIVVQLGVFGLCAVTLVIYVGVFLYDTAQKIWPVPALGLFWSWQVWLCVAHTTTAGVVATWYFSGGSNIPSNPTLNALKRTTTTSFGSVCLGSMLVAIVQLIEMVVRSFASRGGFVALVALCIVQCIGSVVRYFNDYAFVHVAMYGCSYFEAASATWDLTKQCGSAAVFNDWLVSSPLVVVQMAMVLCIELVLDTGLVSLPPYSVIVCVLIPFAVINPFRCAVRSAVMTLFVCFAEQPDALRMSNPALFALLREADQGATQGLV